jgi:hypothetical protein
MNDDFLKEICISGTKEEKLALFNFNVSEGVEIILKKFRLWARSNYPQAFTMKSASFHYDIDRALADAYVNRKNLVIIGFRGCAKTAIGKLFTTFVQQNDLDLTRKYAKILSKDTKNPRQFVTDVYNLHIEARNLYGDLFLREDDKKREETMASFVLRDGRKFSAGTVGQSQRGHMADFSRPDWLMFDDVEDRISISSALITEGIIEGIDEAIAGLSHNGSWIAFCNYISEAGVVEWLKQRADNVIVIPILDEENHPTWEEAFPIEKIEEFRIKTQDFWGEYMCQPQRGENKFFPVEQIEEDLKNTREPKKEVLGVKYWGDYIPNHRYGMGSDHSEGIGKDSNTFCVFDFKTGELVASCATNKVAPDLFAHECMRVAGDYGNCIWAPETNNRCGGIVLSTARERNYPRLHKMHKNGLVTGKDGWETTKSSKTQMLMDFRTSYIDGDVKIYDKNLLREMLSYTNTDLQDTGDSLGMLTRHFDLLIGACIAWQLSPYAIEAQNNNRNAKRVTLSSAFTPNMRVGR